MVVVRRAVAAALVASVAAFGGEQPEPRDEDAYPGLLRRWLHRHTAIVAAEDAELDWAAATVRLLSD